MPRTAPKPPPTDAEAARVDAWADRVLVVVRDLAVELHPHYERKLRVGLDSRLDRDLGLDSLGRAELGLRLERSFHVRLPEAVSAAAETPRQLLMAVLQAEAGGQQLATIEVRRPELGPAEAVAAELAAWTEVLDWHVMIHPDRLHVTLTDGVTEEGTLTYRQLADEARAVADGLCRWGLMPGERAAIMLPTGLAFFRAFFGILYAGAIPVPIYPPVRMAQIEDHLRRQAGILRNAGASILITVAEARPVAALLKAQTESLRAVETVDTLMGPGGRISAPRIRSDDIALLQYTSGSTGDPKGVVLTHANLLANVRTMGAALQADPSDVFVSWLPLYHDMGLIGAWLGSLYFAVPLFILSPLSFLARPERWLWAIHRYRATLSAGPNFAFEHCLRKIDAPALKGVDLGSLRRVANGAEPVSPETIRRFTARFARYGFRPEAMAPVYGLAENSVGLAFPPLGRRPVIDRIRRDALTRRGEAVPADPGDAAALEFVGCGRPLTGHQIRIIDDTGREVGERHEGRVQFRGPSATRGYFRNAAKTRDLFDGPWLNSGDLAYVAGGDIFITGRFKDIIIRAGRNIYPHEVEEAVGTIEGVRKGCVALFGSSDPVSHTERIILLAETRERDMERLKQLHARIVEVATDVLETPPDEVVLAPPHSVPKTSSGKIRRTACRQLYESGQVGTKPRAFRRQMTRLVLTGVQGQIRRGLLTLGEMLYAGHWWAVVGLLAAVVWSLVILLPHRGWRWAVLHSGARWALRLSGTSLKVSGLDRRHLGAASLFVANHASYLDGVVLGAALPGDLIYTVKRELASKFFPRLFLERIDAVFLERAELEGSLEDVRQVADAARAGRPLVFFPEGTLTRMPGLLAFHLGAFMIAAQTGLPVRPVTIRGTRSILRGGQWFPRRGSITVEVGAPLTADGSDFEAAVRLRDRVRADILMRCGEPDLAEEPVIFTRPAR